MNDEKVRFRPIAQYNIEKRFIAEDIKRAETFENYIPAVIKKAEDSVKKNKRRRQQQREKVENERKIRQ